MTFQKNESLNNEMKLWYKTPANKWVEALPVGNGRLGAMVFGKVENEQILLNEETVWAGHEMDSTNPEALEALPIVRKLLFEGKNEEASKLAEEKMMAIPLTIDSYQPLGDLILTFPSMGETSEYRRELDLDSGILSVVYGANRKLYKREIFSSAIDQSIVIRLSADCPGSISFKASLKREKDAEVSNIGSSRMLLDGQCGEKGVKFSACLHIATEGGSIASEGNFLEVRNADNATIYITAASNYKLENHVNRSLRQMEDVISKTYDMVRKSHVEEHQSYFRRMSISLGNSCSDDISTDERLSRIAEGYHDPQFYALYFQYFRYLLFSSSRPGCLPSNLQGIWNDKMNAPWNSDYHPNINLQINYWPAESSGLGDCHTALFDWMEALLESGRKTAKVHYGARGWVLHHVSDIWGCTTPRDGLHGIWPMGGAWLCRHLYEHFLYNMDYEFLQKRAYPIMKDAAQFMLDFLIEAPEGTPAKGYLVTNPSHSPENRFIKPDGTVSWFAYGVTMDFEIITDLFTSCIDAEKKLEQFYGDSDVEFIQELETTLKKLPPLKVSDKTGGIQEWIEDYDEIEPGHRHVSHLYALYPAKQIPSDKTNTLTVAARKTLERKFASGYDGQGWSLGWIANIWARLRDGDRAYDALRNISMNHLFTNLFINAHSQPQVGDAGGIPAAITEMLVQSHEEEINLLPALPSVWSEGCIKGICVRGGYLLDMEWKAGKLQKAGLKCSISTVCRLNTGVSVKMFTNGTPVATREVAHGIYEFEVDKDIYYNIQV